MIADIEVFRSALKTLSQYNVDNLAKNVEASRKAHERTVVALVGGLALVLAGQVMLIRAPKT